MENAYQLFFKALSNKPRAKIVNLLRKGPRNVKEICSELEFEQSMVSHSLKYLESCGFVTGRRNGKSVVYELDRESVLPILEGIDRYFLNYKRWVSQSSQMWGSRRHSKIRREARKGWTG